MTTSTLGGWLVHVMKEADGALSLEEALHVIMDSMKEFFPSQSVAVMLIDDDTKELRIKTSRQISYTFVKKFHKSGPGPIAEQVVLELHPILLNGLDNTSSTYESLKLEHDFSSAVLAPIIQNQRGIGYIFCDRANGEQFSDTDLLHLQVIGYLIGALIEKFELIKASKKLSQIDDATNALQYKAFVPAMTTELQRGTTHTYKVTLALIAVDAFRQYIETHGIDAAHGLLAEVVEIIKVRIRDMDILARFGADEFILCLSGMTENEARNTLAAIRTDVTTKAVGRGDAPIDITIGALILRDEKEMKKGLQEILGELGKALVQAKGKSSERVVIGTIDY
ncbi:MAG: diguanylate cyclase [Kiritimatiellae bacterium]|nr:diguanylate cyclase [Kiritimatiellia bacterium]